MPYVTVMLSWVRSVFTHGTTRMPQTPLTMVKKKPWWFIDKVLSLFLLNLIAFLTQWQTITYPVKCHPPFLNIHENAHFKL